MGTLGRASPQRQVYVEIQKEIENGSRGNFFIQKLNLQNILNLDPMPIYNRFIIIILHPISCMMLNTLAPSPHPHAKALTALTLFIPKAVLQFGSALPLK